MSITVSALRETAAGERRVAITPEVAKKLRGKGLRVLLEHDAGTAAGFPDAAYAEVEFAGATEVLAQADLLACVLPPDDAALARLREGTVVKFTGAPSSAPQPSPVASRTGKAPSP